MDSHLTIPSEGEFLLPKMRFVRIAGTEDPSEILLAFEARSGKPDFLQRKATINIPVLAQNAAELLRSLEILQRSGLIPIEPEKMRPDRDS